MIYGAGRPVFEVGTVAKSVIVERLSYLKTPSLILPLSLTDTGWLEFHEVIIFIITFLTALVKRLLDGNFELITI